MPSISNGGFALKGILLVFLAVIVALVVGCGGGGGGGNSVPARTAFHVSVIDSGAGFPNAGDVNFVLLGTVGGYYQLESIRHISGSDIKLWNAAQFDWSLGRPSNVDASGVGVFEVRVCQGTAWQWHSGDLYDRWRVGGHLYALGYGPPGSAAPGWTVWDFDTTTYICGLSGYRMVISTYFLSRGRASATSGKPEHEVLTEEQMAVRKLTIANKILRGD